MKALVCIKCINIVAILGRILIWKLFNMTAYHGGRSGIREWNSRNSRYLFIVFFGRTRIETLWVLSLFKRSHCQLTNVVTIQGCIPCFFVIEKVSGFSHLPEGTIVVQRTFHAATLAFALKIIEQCSKLTVLICVFSSVNSDEWHCYQLFLVFRWVGYPDENSYVL